MGGTVADFWVCSPVARLTDVQDGDNGDPHGNRDEEGPRGKFDRVSHGCFIRVLAGSFLELLLPRQAPDIPAMRRRISRLRLNPKLLDRTSDSSLLVESARNNVHAPHGGLCFVVADCVLRPQWNRAIRRRSCFELTRKSCVPQEISGRRMQAHKGSFWRTCSYLCSYMSYFRSVIC